MSEIVFRGYLHKSPPESFGSSLKPWRLRWFILADSRLAFPLASPYVRLEYYASEQFANDLNEPKGEILPQNEYNLCWYNNNRSD